MKPCSSPTLAFSVFFALLFCHEQVHPPFRVAVQQSSDDGASESDGDEMIWF